MKHILPWLVSLVFWSIVSIAQEPVKHDSAMHKTETEIVEGDTLLLMELAPVTILPPVRFENRRQAVRYDRLVYNVRKVYPYAKMAGEKLRYYEKVLDTIPTDRERRLYMKVAEKELEARFGKEIRDLTFSQGKVLIKLIYRETGNSTFDLVRELRGGFAAFIYQTLARIFGYDLKSGYFPEGEDIVIEQIVRTIEAEKQ